MYEYFIQTVGCPVSSGLILQLIFWHCVKLRRVLVEWGAVLSGAEPDTDWPRMWARTTGSSSTHYISLLSSPHRSTQIDTIRNTSFPPLLPPQDWSDIRDQRKPTSNKVQQFVITNLLTCDMQHSHQHIHLLLLKRENIIHQTLNSLLLIISLDFPAKMLESKTWELYTLIFKYKTVELPLRVLPSENSRLPSSHTSWL